MNKDILLLLILHVLVELSRDLLRNYSFLPLSSLHWK